MEMQCNSIKTEKERNSMLNATYVRRFGDTIYIRFEDGTVAEDNSLLKQFACWEPEDTMEDTVASMKEVIFNRYGGDVRVAKNVVDYLREIYLELSVQKLHDYPSEKGFCRGNLRERITQREEAKQQLRREAWLQAL